jgi:hypothetical protein
MPKVWGDGKLLTFSGIDGPTSWAHTLVGGATTNPFGIVWRLRPDVLLVFGGLLAGQEADWYLVTPPISPRAPRAAQAICGWSPTAGRSWARLPAR